MSLTKRSLYVKSLIVTLIAYFVNVQKNTTPLDSEMKDDIKENENFAKQKRFDFKYFLLAVLFLSILLLVGFVLELDAFVLGSTLVVVGLITKITSYVVLLLASIPVVGPALVSVLSIPFVWIVNGFGYLASLIAIKRGYSKDVVGYRIITVALIIGIIIGYIIGKYF